MWVTFTPEYLAGTIAGFGLALFCVFLVALSGDVSFVGLARSALGLLGIVLLMVGGFWKLRLQNRRQN